METDEPSTTERPAMPQRRLQRSSGDRIVAGVAGGLGEYFGVDAVLFRIGFVALTVAGGSGIVLYGLGWLLLPELGDPSSAAERVSSFFRRRPVIAIIATVIVVSMMGDGFWWNDGGGQDGLLGICLLVLGIAFLVTRHRGQQPPTPAGPMPPPSPTDASAGTAPLGESQYTDPLLADAFRDDPITSEIWPPLPPGGVATAASRPRPFITPVTISLLLVFGGVAALVGLELQTALAIALLIVGVALLIGSRIGRARGLIAVGLLLVAATTVTSVADLSLAGGTGNRAIRPVVPTQLHPYRLGMGELTIDLTDLRFQGTRPVEARVGAGSLTVYVPPDVAVVANTHVGMGAINAFGRHADGLSVERRYVSPASTETSRRLVLDLEAGLGEIKVEVR